MEVSSIGMANAQVVQTSYRTAAFPDTEGVTTQPDVQQQAVAAAYVVKQSASRSGKGEKGDEIAAELNSKTTSKFLQKSIEQANKHLTGANREFKCSVHEKTGQYIVKIVDSETKEVIKEIPPEKTLDAVAMMWELAGLFVDARK